MKKKLLCIIATFASIFLLPIMANAESEKYEYNGAFLYTINDSRTAITVTDADYGSSYISIPEKINGIPVRSIGGAAFRGRTSLLQVSLPDTITYIGGSAFDGCYNLRSITLPENITEIASYTFDSCQSLRSITIPDKVTSIGQGAFEFCTGITHITIPDSVESIGSFAFTYCSNLYSVDIGKGLKSFGSGYTSQPIGISCDKLSSINVDENNPYFSSVDGVLFNKNKTELIQYPADKIGYTYSVPFGVTKIGVYAFYGCNDLQNITLPSTLRTMGMDCFCSCKSLKSIVIPDMVTSIPSYAFYGCSSLTEITLGANVTEIGSSAFDSCTSLTSITLNKNLRKIGNSAFYKCTALENVYVPSIESYLKIDFETISSLGSESYDSCPMYYASKLYVDNKRVVSITVPDGIKQIPAYAFNNCDSLKNIVLPNSVTSIGTNAFAGCTSLTNVNIPNSVTSIMDSAFNGCSSITELNIPAGVSEIGEQAFSGCGGIKKLSYGASIILENMFSDCSALETLMLSDTVERISENAFANCTDLDTVFLSKGITEIDTNAFYNCSSISHAEYEGSRSELDNVYIGPGNEHLTDVLNTDSPYFAPENITLVDPEVSVSESSSDDIILTITIEQPYIDSAVYAAFYDSNDNFISAEKTTLNLFDSTVIETSGLDNASYAKVFVWTDGMRPITNEQAIPITQ